ncbi:MAG: hypothetical protein JW892_11560 [Anaerolineae bacterium]|nr:hypothetical protein [Anaerolineae bacterium]
MNIFVLSEDPVEAAGMQCDQHVVKMPLESAQMLCTAFENGSAPYRWTHYKHPCGIWARSSRENFLWLVTHALALAEEYRFRFNKVHKSREVILWCREHSPEVIFPEQGLTPFALAMPAHYQCGDAVASYRNFYLHDKSRFARWQHGRPMPDWYRLEITGCENSNVF